MQRKIDEFRNDILYTKKRKREATGGLVVITREYHLADWNKSTFCFKAHA